MASVVAVEEGLITSDQADSAGDQTRYDPASAADRDVMVYRLSGAFFFGATAAVGTVLDRVGSPPKAFVLDFQDVPLIDSSAANTLRGFVKRLRRSHTKVYFAGVRRPVRETLMAAGLTGSLVSYRSSVETALHAAKTLTA